MSKLSEIDNETIKKVVDGDITISRHYGVRFMRTSDREGDNLMLKLGNAYKNAIALQILIGAIIFVIWRMM